MVDGHLEAITRVVGFAVSSDKVWVDQRFRILVLLQTRVCRFMQAKKHLRAELLRRAEAVHIKIIAIDPLKPVAEQGPFDLILQKCRDEGMAALSPFARYRSLPATCARCTHSSRVLHDNLDKAQYVPKVPMPHSYSSCIIVLAFALQVGGRD